MASILRQIVAGPRSRHPEAGLDLCYGMLLLLFLKLFPACWSSGAVIELLVFL